MHPILVLILLLLVLVFVSWYKRAPAEMKTKILIYAGLTVLVLLVLTGRVHWLMAAAGGAIALFQRLLSAKRVFDTLKGLGGNQHSAVETRYLRASLDLETGRMAGEILTGQFCGRRLEELDLRELVMLHAECSRDDPQSVAVLEAYLDRRYGPDWRDGMSSGPRGAMGTESMTRQEAFEVLGIDANATKEQIIQAHRRLMQRVHPDRGGSTYLAARINRAKDVLIAS